MSHIATFLGCGQFTCEASGNSLEYSRHLLRRVRQEMIEDRILENQAHFAREKLAREQRQALEQARFETKLKDLQAKFPKLRRNK